MHTFSEESTFRDLEAWRTKNNVKSLTICFEPDATVVTAVVGENTYEWRQPDLVAALNLHVAVLAAFKKHGV